MTLANNYIVYGIVIIISVSQTSCILSDLTARISASEQNAGSLPSACSDPVKYYHEHNSLAVNELSNVKPEYTDNSNQSNACLKLYEAIRLSSPGNKQQDDKKAISIYEELKSANTLATGDLKFNNMILQHIVQRESLRKTMATQNNRLVDAEAQNTVLRKQLAILQSQLDQLKNIEIEINKKERSVTSPIDE